MGGINSKEEIVARLNELDKEEININKQLRELQIELNGIVPVRDRVKVKSEYFDNISINEDINNSKEKESSDEGGVKSKKKKSKMDESIKKKTKKSKKKK